MSDAAETERGMRRGSPAALVVLLVVAVQLSVGVYLVQSRIDRRFGIYRATEEILYIQDGVSLKKVLLGFDSLAADIYWLRTVQYFGGKRLEETEKNFDLLAPLLTITTDLDPNLKIAYSYGVVFLSESYPRGAADPQRALELIDKGIENHPDYWRFYLDKGFIYFWYLDDYAKAAEVFLEGSKIEGAPYWMVAMAGRTATQGGDRETARHLWQILLETAENDQMRGNAATHLQQLDALDAIETLTPIVKEFQERSGHFPSDWRELIAAGLLPGTPADPLGFPFVLNPREETIEISKDSSLAGLPNR